MLSASPFPSFFSANKWSLRCLAMEQRITARVDLNAQMLAEGIKEILDLASPESGGTK